MKTTTALSPLFLILIFLTAFTAEGRRIDLRLRESQTRQPVGGVMVKLKSGSKILSYGRSDRNGLCSLETPDSLPQQATVEIASDRYDPLSVPARELKEGMALDLTPVAAQLAELVVRPVVLTQKGDTLSYSVDAMKNVADRNIEDVIGRLPGVTVNNGQISYNGEPINRFYVEGLDGLGGAYSMATQNIRADDVATIDVYENHEPVQAMKDFKMSKNAAINIKLKKRSLLRPSGYLEAGSGKSGDGAAWLGKGFLMLIAPRMQVYSEAGGNNFGLSPGKGGAYTTNVPAPLGDQLSLSSVAGINVASSLYTLSRRAQGNVKTALKTGKYGTLRLGAGYGWQHLRRSGSTFNRYPLPDTDSVYSILQEASSLQRRQSVSANVDYEYNAPTVYLSNAFSSGVAFSRGNATVLATPGRNVAQSLDKNDIVVSDFLKAIVRKPTKIWEGMLTTGFHDLPLNRLKASDRDSAVSIVDQSVRSRAFNLKASTSLSWNVGNHGYLGLNLNFNETYSRVHTEGYEGAAMQLIGINNLSGNDAVLSAGPMFRFTQTRVRFEVSVPVEFRWQDFRGLADGKDYNKAFVNFAPSAWVYFYLPNELKGNLGADFSQSNSGLETFLTAPIATTYRTVYIPGSGIPSTSSVWKASTQWSWRKVRRGFFVSASASYLSFTSDRMATLEIDPEDITTGSAHMRNRTDQFTTALNLSQLMMGQKATLKLDLSYGLTNSSALRNGVKLDFGNSNLTGALSFSAPLLNDRLVVKPTALVSKSWQSSGADFSASYTNWQGSLPLTVLLFKGFDITVTPDFRSNALGADNRMNVFILSGSARWRLGKWDLQLRVNNLTDRRRYAVESWSNLVYTSQVVPLNGLEALLSVKYNF